MSETHRRPVDAALARALVDTQYAGVDPAGAAGELRLVDRGMDNVIFRLGRKLAVRLPVREEAAPLIDHEARWLAEVSEPLTLATPVPVFLGEPQDDYPWRWTVCPWIDGEPLARLPVESRGGIVDDLAGALVALHRPAPVDAPANPYRGVALVDRDEVVSARIERFDGPVDALGAAWRRALAAPAWPGPPYWLHGDPHPLNLLHRDGRLSGLIDFGDLTSGDPASDLAAAWWCFGPADRARFVGRVRATGRYDAHVWERAAGWAASLASAIRPDTPMAPVARHTAAQLARA